MPFLRALKQNWAFLAVVLELVFIAAALGYIFSDALIPRARPADLGAVSNGSQAGIEPDHLQVDFQDVGERPLLAQS